MSLTKATYSMISGACVNVLDYGADLTGSDDSTTAIANAIAAGGRVYFPKGVYKCNITVGSDGIYLCGESQGQYGTEGARLIPADDTLPVIDVVGPVISCVVENFILDSQLDSNFSHTGIGLRVQATSPDFVWRCSFRHLFIRGFQDGLVIDCDINLSEVFDNDFQDIECLGISRFSFKTRGVYNRFGKLFATQVGIAGGSQPTSDYAFYHDGSNCFFDSAVSSGRQYWAGTGNFVGNAVIEAIDGPGTGAAGSPAMELSGTGLNTWMKVRVNGSPASKYPVGVRLAGTLQTVGDIIIEGSPNLPTTGLLFASGSSGVIINATQSGSVPKTSQPDGWNFLGDVTDSIAGGGPKPSPWLFKDAWDGSRYIIPDATWNIVINPASDPLTTGNLVMPQSNPPLDGQTVTISTTKDITTMNFKTEGIYGFYTGSQTISEAFTAGSSKSFIYQSSDHTWYPN